MNTTLLSSLYSQKGVSVKFAIIGGVGFVCNYAVLWLCNEKLYLPVVLAEVVAAAVALQITFAFHDRWTYRADPALHRYHLKLWQRYRAYVLSNSFASLLTVAFFAVFSLFLPHFIALAISALAGLAWNFIMNKSVIWRHTEHTSAKSD